MFLQFRAILIRIIQMIDEYIDSKCVIRSGPVCVPLLTKRILQQLKFVLALKISSNHSIEIESHCWNNKFSHFVLLKVIDGIINLTIFFY